MSLLVGRPDLLTTVQDLGRPTVQAIAGQEYELFDEKSRHWFFHEPFTVLPQSDRMGYRLKGSPLLLREQRETISSAVTFGTVQVHPDGNPIMVTADHQITGGYSKIAQVISADLPLLAQTNLGGKVSFRLVSLRRCGQRSKNTCSNSWLCTRSVAEWSKWPVYDEAILSIGKGRE